MNEILHCHNSQTRKQNNDKGLIGDGYWLLYNDGPRTVV